MMLDRPIETPRLILRELQEDDFADVHEYASDPEVVRFLPFGPNTEAQTMEFIQRQLRRQREDDRQAYELGVVPKSEGKIIGAGGVKLFNKGLGAIGYTLNRKYWGKGYATELARALVEFGFTRLNLHRIFALCDVENHASARVLEKNGMRREGHFIDDCRIRDEWRSSFLYAILDREWRKANGR